MDITNEELEEFDQEPNEEPEMLELEAERDFQRIKNGFSAACFLLAAKHDIPWDEVELLAHGLPEDPDLHTLVKIAFKLWPDDKEVPYWLVPAMMQGQITKPMESRWFWKG